MYKREKDEKENFQAIQISSEDGDRGQRKFKDVEKYFTPQNFKNLSILPVKLELVNV